MFTIPNGQIVKTVNLSKDWARAVIDIPVPTSADLNVVNDVLHGVAEKAMEDPSLSALLLDAPQMMGVESIELDTVNLRMVARTLPGKQFEVGRRLRVLVRAREVGIVGLAAVVGGVAGLVVTVMAAIVMGLHYLFFDIPSGTRLSANAAHVFSSYGLTVGVSVTASFIRTYMFMWLSGT